MKKPAVRLPDVDDDAEFAARLNPLASKLLPGTPDRPISGIPDKRISNTPNVNQSDILDIQKTETDRQSTASRRDEIEAKRGPKKRYEYVLPVRVGDALANDAREKGVSATARLLEVLRTAGYPVIPEDLLDLRLERGRK